MRIVFMGTPEFAVPSLDILVKHGYDIAAVITAPDSKGGRGGKLLIESDVKKYAISKGLKVFQPTNLKSTNFVEQLKTLRADVQVVVAFRMLPEVVWNMPPMGTINLHGSLLPKYRGAAPIHHAVINGEKETGVTTFRLKHEIDTGDIILQQKIEIDEDDTTGDVHDKMMFIGAQTLLRTVQMIENNQVIYTHQAEAPVSQAPKLFHHNCQIDFDQNTEKVYNFIRGLSPFPGAWTKIEDKEWKIYKSSMDKNIQIGAGNIKCDKKDFLIGCKDGTIRVLSLKEEGRRQMNIAEFLNGHTITASEIDRDSNTNQNT